MSKDRFTFTEKLAALKKAKVDMPKIIAETGQRYFMLNFKKQQSPNGIKWNPRLKETKRTIGKPILVNTGRLKGSMENIIISYDYKRIIWGTKNISYAGYLNYGTSKMVARPFIADGKEIRGKIKGIIKREFDKIMKAK